MTVADTTDPVITFESRTPANGNGWNNSDVTVTWSCSDSGSGVVSPSVSQTVSTEGEGQPAIGTCIDLAGNTAMDTVSGINIDKTAPTAAANASPDPNANGWNNSDVTVSFDGEDELSGIDSCAASVVLTEEGAGQSASGTCTDKAGNVSAPATVSNINIDKTDPTIEASVKSGTPGTNSWYVSDVVVEFTCKDTLSGIPANACPDVETLGTEGAAVSSTAKTVTDQAGNVSAASNVITVKIDKTAPTDVKLAVTAGTEGANGWYTSDVKVSTTGSDSVSTPVVCTPDQNQTEETAGAVFTGFCTNDAGLESAVASLTVKLDKTAPTDVKLAVTAGTEGANGWYTSDVKVSTTGSDSVSTPVVCTPDQNQTEETAGAVFTGSCTNDAGLESAVASLTVKLDKTAPVITLALDPNPIILNGSALFTKVITDGISGVFSESCEAIDNTSVGSKTVTCTATNTAGLSGGQTLEYSVVYATGGMCLGSPSHAILQPINADGTSVFKQKSTVPAKFRVCDADGVSIGTPGIVTGFKLVKYTFGTVSESVDEAVDSTTPDTAFRWSASDQQWIFNISTKTKTAKYTYFYEMTLNDGSKIPFSFGLK